MQNIINDLRSTTKEKDKNKSRDLITESDVERKLKGYQTIIDNNEKTIESSRIDRSEFSELNVTNSKTHRKYESYHNIGSIIPKKKELDSNSKTIVSKYVNFNLFYFKFFLVHESNKQWR